MLQKLDAIIKILLSRRQSRIQINRFFIFKSQSSNIFLYYLYCLSKMSDSEEFGESSYPSSDNFSQGSQESLQEFQNRCLRMVFGYNPFDYQNGFPSSQPQFDHGKYLGILEEEDSFSYLNDESNSENQPEGDMETENFDNLEEDLGNHSQIWQNQIQAYEIYEKVQNHQFYQQNMNEENQRPAEMPIQNNRWDQQNEDSLPSYLQQIMYWNPNTGKHQLRPKSIFDQSIFLHDQSNEVIYSTYDAPTQDSVARIQNPQPKRRSERIKNKRLKQNKNSTKKSGEQENQSSISSEMLSQSCSAECSGQKDFRRKKTGHTSKIGVDEHKPDIMSIFKQAYSTPLQAQQILDIHQKSVQKFPSQTQKENKKERTNQMSRQIPID